jgi:hypothetical protein
MGDAVQVEDLIAELDPLLHPPAVFATLAETITTEDWFGITAELPEEYFGLLPAV